MSDAWYAGAVAGRLAAGDALRRRASGGERVNVEFVSANPTGPITVASGRHAAYGDSLCRILEFAGNEVEREYYVNDYGSQVERFGESIRARAKGEEPPEDGYQGDYVEELADRIDGAAEMRRPTSSRGAGWSSCSRACGAPWSASGCSMDRFLSERANHEMGRGPGGARSARGARPDLPHAARARSRRRPPSRIRPGSRPRGLLPFARARMDSAKRSIWRAVVVHVVLALDLVARELEDAAERIAVGGVAAGRDGYRPGGVRAHELHVHPLAAASPAP